MLVCLKLLHENLHFFHFCDVICDVIKHIKPTTPKIENVQATVKSLVQFDNLISISSGVTSV